MDIPVNAEVFTTDGLAGRSTAVIIDPTSRKVTHLVVKEHSFPHVEHLVPIELVTSATPDSIDLRSTRAELIELEPFRYSDYVAGDTAYDVYGAEQFYWGPFIQASPLMAADRSMPIAYDHVPPGELVVHKGGKVVARDGQVGRVDEFLADPRDGRITHLVLREGHLWGQRDVTVPVSEIDHIEDEHVYLKLDKDAVEHLPLTAGAQYARRTS